MARKPSFISIPHPDQPKARGNYYEVSALSSSAHVASAGVEGLQRDPSSSLLLVILVILVS